MRVYTSVPPKGREPKTVYVEIGGKVEGIWRSKVNNGILVSGPDDLPLRRVMPGDPALPYYEDPVRAGSAFAPT